MPRARRSGPPDEPQVDSRKDAEIDLYAVAGDQRQRIRSDAVPAGFIEPWTHAEAALDRLDQLDELCLLDLRRQIARIGVATRSPPRRRAGWSTDADGRRSRKRRARGSRPTARSRPAALPPDSRHIHRAHAMPFQHRLRALLRADVGDADLMAGKGLGPIELRLGIHDDKQPGRSRPRRNRPVFHAEQGGGAPAGAAIEPIMD